MKKVAMTLLAVGLMAQQSPPAHPSPSVYWVSMQYEKGKDYEQLAAYGTCPTYKLMGFIYMSTVDGVYHKVSAKHLARYIDEFAWRLNEGNVARHTLERLDSFIDCIVGKRLTYERLIAKVPA